MLGWVAFALATSSFLYAEQSEERFESRVRPLLIEKCYSCHTDSKMGGLQLDSREHLLQGGKSGPAAVPGDPDASLIVTALRQSGKLKMPPGGKLRDQQIEDITAWIRAGAVWPQLPEAQRKQVPITAGQRAFWAFLPVKPPTPPAVLNPRWAATPIDRFILARLEAKKLLPVRPAGRRELIRRATYDLTGLPPTPGEVAAFERDRSPQAFERVVDRLLASPRYGERQARLWLDVARYSDDKLDSERDNPYPNSFRYRDWVIQAMQDDMPYDLFVKAQIAGDRLPEHQKYEAGLGFYALSPEFQDDRVGATSRGFLGLTVACAQCHDHKYDPIPTRDYYALLGIFRNTELSEVPLAPGAEVERYRSQNDLIKKKEEELKKFLATQARQLSEILAAGTARYLLASGADLDAETLDRWKKYLAKSPKDHVFLAGWEKDRSRTAAEAFQKVLLDVIAEKTRIDEENHIRLGLNPTRQQLSDANLVSLARDKYVLWKDVMGEKGVLYYGEKEIDRFLSGAWKGHLARLRTELADAKKALPPAYPFLQVVKDRAKPEVQKVWIRGNEDNPGDPAPPRFLSVLSSGEPRRLAAGNERLELAEAIASPRNPLTARVFVNRIWRQHFGQGIVRTPSNFGNQGDRPSHPELLDYLADRFVREGWSIKKLHRALMLTEAYKLSAENSARNYAEDPENRLLWRHNRRRLDAESLRDSMLAVAGTLDQTPGGPAARLEADYRRRTVYGFVSRRRLDPLLALFDFPNPNNTSEQRMETTVPLQKLFFMNSEFVTRQAQALAARICGQASGDDERVRHAYRLVLQREPGAQERRLALEFLRSSSNAWPLYAKVMLSSNEFIYLD